MLIDDIRKLMARVPFESFVIRMSDGQEYPVPTLDHVFVTPTGFSVVVSDDKGSVVILPVRHMSGLRYQENGA